MQVSGWKIPSSDLIPSLFCNCSIVPPMHIWAQNNCDNLHRLQDFLMSQDHFNIGYKLVVYKHWLETK